MRCTFHSPFLNGVVIQFSAGKNTPKIALSWCIHEALSASAGCLGLTTEFGAERGVWEKSLSFISSIK